MTSTLRRLLLLFAVLPALAAGLAACGEGSDEDPTKVLNETFGTSRPVKSAKLDLDLDIAVRGTGAGAQAGPISLKLSGPFQTRGRASLPAFDFDVRLAAGGRSVDLGAISTGTAGYVVYQGQAYQLSDQAFAQFRAGFRQTASQRSGQRDRPLSAFGVDPRRWIRGAETKGTEDIGGTETVHVSARVNVPRMLEDVSKIAERAGGAAGAQGRQVAQQLSPAQRVQLARSVRSARIDVYSGVDDKSLRRLVVTLDLAGRTGSGATGSRVAFALTLSELNEQQTVSAPKNAKPLSDLTNALQGGGAGGQAEGGSAYEQCLARAGGDIAKQQQCAALLGSG